MTLFVLPLLLLADVPPPPGPVVRPAPAECRASSDCVLSTFDGCCGSCCGREPHAIVRGSKEGEICAAVDCALPNCNAVKCAAVRNANEFVPVCRAGRCVAELKGQPPSSLECRDDRECTVVTTPPPGAACFSSPCGCCPSPRAASVDAPVALVNKPRPTPQPAPSPTPNDGKPSYGLSTGGTPLPPPQPVNCSPCPGFAPARAACVGGRCILAQRPPPPG